MIGVACFSPTWHPRRTPQISPHFPFLVIRAPIWYWKCAYNPSRERFFSSLSETRAAVYFRRFFFATSTSPSSLSWLDQPRPHGRLFLDSCIRRVTPDKWYQLFGQSVWAPSSGETSCWVKLIRLSVLSLRLFPIFIGRETIHDDLLRSALLSQPVQMSRCSLFGWPPDFLEHQVPEYSLLFFLCQMSQEDSDSRAPSVYPSSLHQCPLPPFRHQRRPSRLGGLLISSSS